MLKLKYLYENYDLARLALENWPHDGGLDELLAQFRISNNAVYPFRQAGAACFLRLTPAEERLERNVWGELEFLEYLERRDYPALRYIPAASGERLLTLDTPYGRWYAAAFRHVGGVPLERTELAPQVMRAYGRALGRLHALSEEYEPCVQKWDYLDALDWIDRVLEKYHAPAKVSDASRGLRRELAALPRDSSIYGLIHYDFEYDNVFYDAASGECRAIDFDDGLFHWFAMDVERAMMALEEDQDELGLTGTLQAESQFLEGYCAEHPFTRDMESSRPLMRQFAELHSYAKLIRSVAEKLPDEPDWMAELRGKLGRKIHSLEERCLTAIPRPALGKEPKANS